MLLGLLFAGIYAFPGIGEGAGDLEKGGFRCCGGMEVLQPPPATPMTVEGVGTRDVGVENYFCGDKVC